MGREMKLYLLTNDGLPGIDAEEHDRRMSVSDLIGEALEREFAELFHEHYSMVHRTAYGVTGNASDAEDVAQTIFLRLLKRKFPLDLKRNPRAYLYRAAVNLSLNIIQQKKRHVLTDDVEQFESQSFVTAGDAPEEVHRRLFEAVAELSPESAQILILRYVHNYTDAEIARLLGTSRGTIAVSLYRSRRRLRKLMRASSFPGGES
jgi:RNA polymerase sigma-70 factor (ECF subfamily)